MSKKKLEKDYLEYSLAIENKAKEEIQKIKEKIEKVKKEAEETGRGLKLSSKEKCNFEE
jgi:ABC-type enterochelin transport system substrate-binding protein